MFRLLLIWQLLQAHSRPQPFPTGRRLPPSTAHLSHSQFLSEQGGVKIKGKKNLLKAAWAEIATLIAPILWLLVRRRSQGPASSEKALGSSQQLSAEQLKCP